MADDSRTHLTTWVTFGISTVGALLIAGMTINPEQGMANLQGWGQFLLPVEPQQAPAGANQFPPSNAQEWLDRVRGFVQVAAMVFAIGALVFNLLFRRRRDA